MKYMSYSKVNRTKKYNTKPNHQWDQRFQNSDSPPTTILGFIITCIPLSTIWILLFFDRLNIPTGVLHVFILTVTFARVIIIAWKPKRNPGTRNILITCYNCSIHLNSRLDLMWIIYYHNRFWHYYCTTPLPNKYMRYWAKLQTERERMLYRHINTQNVVLPVRILGEGGQCCGGGGRCGWVSLQVEMNRIGNCFVPLNKTDEPCEARNTERRVRWAWRQERKEMATAGWERVCAARERREGGHSHPESGGRGKWPLQPSLQNRFSP